MISLRQWVDSRPKGKRLFRDYARFIELMADQYLMYSDWHNYDPDKAQERQKWLTLSYPDYLRALEGLPLQDQDP